MFFSFQPSRSRLRPAEAQRIVIRGPSQTGMFPIPLSLTSSVFDVTDTPISDRSYMYVYGTLYNEQRSVCLVRHNCCHSTTHPPSRHKSPTRMYQSHSGLPRKHCATPLKHLHNTIRKKKEKNSASPWTKCVFNLDKASQTGPPIASLPTGVFNRPVPNGVAHSIKYTA